MKGKIKFRKKIFTILFAMLMIFSLKGMTVYADSSIVEISSGSELTTALSNSSNNGKTLKLTADITGNFTYNQAGKSITIDLNNHSITGSANLSSVISVKGGTLTIADNAETKTTHYYYIGKTGDYSSSYLGEIVSSTSDTKYVNAVRRGSFDGGYITGGTGTPYSNPSSTTFGGGVMVDGGTFVLESGCIFGNYPKNNGNGGNGGGGVAIRHNGSSFVMNGGYIIGNHAGRFGGGVRIDGGTFAMNGGEIRHNTANTPGSGGAGAGGAIHLGGLDGGGTVTINGGIIRGNLAGLKDGVGAGINVAGGNLVITGGTITGNNVSSEKNLGGGINGPFTVSGNPIISGNKVGGTFVADSYEISGGTVNNAYLPNSKVITFAGALSNTANIGITMQTAGIFTNSTGSDYAKDYRNRFFEDKNATIYIDGNELTLIPNASTPFTVSFNPNGGSGIMEDVIDLTGTYTLPANEFTAPEKKQFKGWSLTSDGDIVTTVEMTEDREVFAIWEDLPTITSISFSNKEVTYDGQTHGLTVTGSLVGGTILYSTDGETWSETMPVYTNVGNYTVYYKATKEGNSDLTGSATIKINPKEISNPTVELSVEEFTYDGEEKKPTIILKDGNGNVIPESEYEVTYSDNTNAGEGKITIKNKVGSNYTIDTTKTFTINKANITGITFDDEEATYDGNEHTIKKTGSFDGTTIKYSTDGNTWVDEMPKYTNAGEYDIYYKVTKANYNDLTGSKKLTINPKEISNPTVELSVEEIIYDGEEKKPNITLKDGNGNVIPESEYEITYSDNVDAGTGTMTIKNKVGSNYIIDTTKTFTISKANITGITFDDEEATYDGNEHTIKETGSFAGATIKYSTDGNTWVDEMPKYTNAGEYDIYYKVTKANYNDLTGSKKLTINPKELLASELTITPVNSKMTYTGNEITQGVIIKLGDEVISNDEYELTYSNNIELGTATITITNKNGGNYIVNGSTTFEIIEKGVAKVIEPTEPNDNGARTTETAEELLSKIEFTDEELAAENEGKNISVYLEVKDISDSVSASDKEKIEKELGSNDTIGMYLDVNLFKKVDGEEATKITETKEEIEISFEIPESLRNSNSKISRTFTVFRLHNGVVTPIKVTLNGNIGTFKTKEFSTYALAYTDTTITSNPQTGDTIMSSVIMLIISGLGLASVLGYTVISNKRKLVKTNI